MKFEWELIYKSEDKITETWRAKVRSGWLVKDFNCMYTDNVEDIVTKEVTFKEKTRRYSSCVAMTFIEDEDHEWIIEK